MRVWDLHPGYLSRGNLLGQHAEIHAVWSVVVNERKGYSRHPETIRWRSQLPWLNWLHRLTVAEMALRGYKHASPLAGEPGPAGGLEYVDPPAAQLSLLAGKYRGKPGGRMQLPDSVACFWRQHRHSVMVRCGEKYNTMAAQAARLQGASLAAAGDYITAVTELLASPADAGLLQHIFGRGAQPVWGRLQFSGEKALRRRGRTDNTDRCHAPVRGGF